MEQRSEQPPHSGLLEDSPNERIAAALALADRNLGPLSARSFQDAGARASSQYMAGEGEGGVCV